MRYLHKWIKAKSYRFIFHISLTLKDYPEMTSQYLLLYRKRTTGKRPTGASVFWVLNEMRPAVSFFFCFNRFYSILSYLNYHCLVLYSIWILILYHLMAELLVTFDNVLAFSNHQNPLVFWFFGPLVLM